MSRTVSKSRIFALTTEVSDERLKLMRQAPQAAQASLEAGATYWHTGILPKHFEKSASAKYGYARRATSYLMSRGKGSKPDLVNTGAMRRELLAAATFKKSARSVELKMHARVLNLVPRMPENGQDAYVIHGNYKKGTQKAFPNMKREIKAVTDQERADVADVVQAELAQRFDVEAYAKVQRIMQHVN